MKIGAKTLSIIMDGVFIRGNGDTIVKSISIDTRTLNPGDFFLVFKGAKVDAHAFIGEAIKKSCGGIILTNTEFAPFKPKDLPIIEVSNPGKALYNFARYIRVATELFPWYAITGSVGKTSAKGFLASILECEGAKPLASPGNYNTDIGIPLALASFLNNKHDAIVLELAMRARGEIDYLAEMIRPHYGLITSIAPAHLETLGNMDLIAEAKGELLRHVDIRGAAILDVDCPYFQMLAGKYTGRIVTFSNMGSDADVRAFDWNWDDEKNIQFKLSIGREEASQVSLKTPSMGIAKSAVAASAAAYAGKIQSRFILEGLPKYKGEELRMNIFQKESGVNVILDCYNANPASMADALQVLSLYKKDGRTIALLGGMLELGFESREWHAKIADQVIKLGIDIVLSVGKEGSFYFDRLRESNFKSNFHFMVNQEAIEWLRKNIKSTDTVLIKGSRAFKLEEVGKAEW